ncbi:hypothetical protein AB1N83_010888 [Pleurotus pulmonarius]
MLAGDYTLWSSSTFSNFRGPESEYGPRFDNSISFDEDGMMRIMDDIPTGHGYREQGEKGLSRGILPGWIFIKAWCSRCRTSGSKHGYADITPILKHSLSNGSSRRGASIATVCVQSTSRPGARGEA